MTRAKRPYEGTPAYEAGFKDGYDVGWDDCKSTILKWINSIKEDNPNYTIEDTSRVIKIIGDKSER